MTDRLYDNDPPEGNGGNADGNAENERGGGGSDLWRLLQEDGQLAGTPDLIPAASPGEPAPAAELDTKQEFERWRRGETEEGGEVSRLRRMIDSPDQLDEGFDYSAVSRARVDDAGDIDAAVARFYSDDVRVVTCRNHPEVESVAQCPECQAFYCQACVVVRKGRMLCRDCADAVFVASEEEVLRAQEEGREAPEAEVAAEIPPEFQFGRFGIEGAPANPLKKLLAWAIDISIVRLLLVLAVMVGGGLLNAGWIPEAAQALFAEGYEGPVFRPLLTQAFTLNPLGFWLPVLALADFVYYFIFLAFNNRTLGMSWTGCRIVSEWGDYVGFGAILLRTLVFVLLLELPAILVSFVLPKFRGPHDLAAGTVVINYSGVKRVDAYETVPIRL